MQDYIIADDVIPKSFADYVESRLLSAPFSYLSNITFLGREEYLPGFHHNIFKDGQQYSALHDVTMSLLYNFSSFVNIEVNKLLQSRLFLQLPILTTRNRNTSHRDLETDHLVFLYYATDSDGPTVIFNKTSKYDDKEEVIAVVEPKKGRGLFFNGKYYHCSSPPKTSTRLILNMDFV